MANAPNSLRVEILTEDQWARLQLVRLAALQDDPSAFLSNHEKEAMFDEEQWRQEFDRGQWNIMIADEAGEIGLLGVTRETAMSEQECYLEYLWVKRGFR